MHHVLSRLYEHKKDFPLIIDLITKVRPPEHLNDYPVEVDLEENLESAAIHSNTRLWFEDDQPIAWAYVDEFNNLWWEMDKRYEKLLGAQIVDWGEDCVRKTLGNDKWTSLDTSCREDYAKRIAFLRQFGFQQTENSTLRMIRDLSKPIPGPKLPPGFVIRPIAGMQEAEKVAAMHRAAFGTDYMTTENRLTIMNTREYDPSLDLVVIAPGGAMAASCICSVNEANKIGTTDPIGTHPKYQRMGLARALLLAGLGYLRERGMFFVQLGTSGDNIAMQKAAQSIGFIVRYKFLWFSREVK